MARFFGCCLTAAVVLACGIFVAAPATAAPAVEISASQSLQLAPGPAGQSVSTMLMIAPSYAVSPVLSAQLGVGMALDSHSGEMDLELRPTALITPTGVPFYGRLVMVAGNLLSDSSFGLGANIGAASKFAPVVLFVETGLVPRSGKGPGGHARMLWIIEGRVGLRYEFE